MSISNILESYSAKFNIDLNKDALNRFEIYSEELIKWNENVNLTRIVEPNEIAVKHFLDSLMLLKEVEVKDSASLIDIGTGAGFPGVPIKIVRNDIDLTLLDSLNKRLIFLNYLMEKIDLSAKIIHSRAEEGGKNLGLRENFDIATSRAVAPLRVLAEYCLPYVKCGGVFVAMKGPNIETELNESKNAINELGGKIREVKSFNLPDDSGRSIVIIEKIVNTPEKYPRHGSKISKEPL